ncbi:MAG TPA: STAS domain-containing protein [Roseiflexaceae bacterium]|nr:STAS domain-containing protein [Roseiflexaceae bacterium]
MRITQRQVVLGLQMLMLVGVAVIFVILLFTGGTPDLLIRCAVGTVVGGVILWLSWRRWRFADQLLLLSNIVLSAFIPPDPWFNRDTLLSLLIPAIFALIVGRPGWALFGPLMSLALVVLRNGGAYPLEFNAPTLVIFSMLIGGMALVGIVTRTAQERAEENARRADAERDRAERQATELALANEQLSSQLSQERRLTELVATLETPVAPLAEGVLLAPIVGHLDTRRAQQLTARLLREAHGRRAKLVVLDIAGVAQVDTTVARALLDTAQALRLLGCSVALSGISANVAAALAQLGVSMEGVMTVRGPQEALARYQEAKA